MLTTINKVEIKLVLILLVVLPLAAFSQGTNGIKFEDIANWNALKQQAKKEYRYLFIECLKDSSNRDNSITQANISDNCSNFYNTRFLSIKILSPNLDELNRQLEQMGVEPVSLYLKRKESLPLLIYLSPESKLVHLAIDIQQPEDLIGYGKQALSPADQYITLLKRYEMGIREYSLMPNLALTTLRFGDTETAIRIARDYKNNYLEKRSFPEMARRENMDFLSKFVSLVHYGDRVFELLLQHGKLVDQETFTGNAENYMYYLIDRDEIQPSLWQGDHVIANVPDWSALFSRIQKKYGDRYAQNALFNAKIKFYEQTKKCNEYVNLIRDHLQKHPPKPGKGLSSDSWQINHRAWYIFQSCKDIPALEQALAWSDLSIKLDPENVQYQDTKANILYKLGRVKEAIGVEESAVKAGIVSANRRGLAKGDFYDEYQKTIRKMKDGIPTWKSNETK